MSTHVLLNLYTKLRKSDQRQGCAEHFVAFLQQVK